MTSYLPRRASQQRPVPFTEVVIAQTSSFKPKPKQFVSRSRQTLNNLNPRFSFIGYMFGLRSSRSLNLQNQDERVLALPIENSNAGDSTEEISVKGPANFIIPILTNNSLTGYKFNLESESIIVVNNQVNAISDLIKSGKIYLDIPGNIKRMETKMLSISDPYRKHRRKFCKALGFIDFTDLVYENKFGAWNSTRDVFQLTLLGKKILRQYAIIFVGYSVYQLLSEPPTILKYFGPKFRANGLIERFNIKVCYKTALELDYESVIEYTSSNGQPPHKIKYNSGNALGCLKYVTDEGLEKTFYAMKLRTAYPLNPVLENPNLLIGAKGKDDWESSLKQAVNVFQYAFLGDLMDDLYKNLIPEDHKRKKHIISELGLVEVGIIVTNPTREEIFYGLTE